MDDRNYRFTSSFVAALAELGVGHAVVAPGSRNTPMSITLAATDRVRDWSFHDERSAGFFALGIGKATGSPALVTCTSGTAAAELHPAVVESRYGRVPLIVVTADRPGDLWETGAAQTIDQRGLFGSAPVWSHDLDVPAPGDAAPGLPAALAARLVAESLQRPGPVHLNLRFREPLVPDGPLPDPIGPIPRVDVGRAEPGSAAVGAALELLAGKRGLIVAGPQHHPHTAAATASAAAALGFPILADPQAGMMGAAIDRSMLLTAGTTLVDAGAIDAMPPEAVLRIGPPHLSKRLGEWLAAHPEVPQVHIDDDAWRDPGATLSQAIRADAALTLTAIAAAAAESSPAGWADGWLAADREAAAAVVSALAELPFPTEPGIAATVGANLPGGALLYVASSMPIRDVALTFAPSDQEVRIASNRGANGIDGMLSSALGAAAAGTGPVVALCGDLSALHDLTSLAAAARHAIPLTVVIVDNDGGGIFHFLPQHGHPAFERHFGTPHGLDLVAAAAALGAEASVVEDGESLAALVAAEPSGPRVAVVRTDRDANVAVHRQIGSAVEEALSSRFG